MSIKMDRQGVRRPADLERKYNFKKRFDETQKTADEAKKIASEISQTDAGLSLKVEALDNELNGENGVRAQLALKVETDADGNLKSKVHVSGNEFTVDTENFSLDENGNVAISGAFNTKSSDGEYSTKIEGGEILVSAPYFEGVTDTDGNTVVAHQIMCFTGVDGEKYGLFACGKYLPSLETGEDTFSYIGTMIAKIE